MLENSLQVIRVVLAGDPTITAPARRELLRLLVNGKPQTPEPAADDAGPRILRRAEVARRLGRTVRSVDELAAQGILTKVKFANRKRSAGILGSSLSAALSVS